MKWTTPPQSAWPAGAEAYVKAVRAGVHGVCQRYVPLIENWMKANKVWEDQTADAVQSLYSAVEPVSAAQVVDVIEVIMAHGVIYGYWLEGVNYLEGFTITRQGQKYAIVMPALDRFGPLIMRDIRRLFR